MSVRLKTGLWVSAHVRLCQSNGAFATIVQHGDDDAGALFVKIWHGAGRASLFNRSIDEYDQLVWRECFDGPNEEQFIDERLAREQEIDRDIWVLEIEGCDGTGFLDPIIRYCDG